MGNKCLLVHETAFNPCNHALETHLPPAPPPLPLPFAKIAQNVMHSAHMHNLCKLWMKCTHKTLFTVNG